MNIAKVVLLGLMIATTAVPAKGDEVTGRPLRFGNTSGWWFYDGRSDHRDVPTNGYFPGNFATDRIGVAAAPLFAPPPERSATPYPSQIILGAPANKAR